jgi:hypothetical protein
MAVYLGIYQGPKIRARGLYFRTRGLFLFRSGIVKGEAGLSRFAKALTLANKPVLDDKVGLPLLYSTTYNPEITHF